MWLDFVKYKTNSDFSEHYYYDLDTKFQKTRLNQNQQFNVLSCQAVHAQHRQLQERIFHYQERCQILVISDFYFSFHSSTQIYPDTLHFDSICYKLT